MSNSQTNSQENGLSQAKLFDLLYYFPTSQEQLKDTKKVQATIRQVIMAIKKLQKSSVDQIERICNTNKKLQSISRFLFNDKMSTLVVNLFTHLLLSSKMLNFIVKLNVPLIIYRNIIRMADKDREQERGRLERFKERDKDRDKANFLAKDKYFQECFKFIYEYCKLQPKKFPRFYANLVSGFVAMYSQDKSMIYPVYSLILQTSVQILRNNLRLAAQSQILLNLFDKVISGDVQLQKTKQIMDVIVSYCNSKQTRDIVHGCIDLGKAFSRFNNVDLRHNKQFNNQLNTPASSQQDNQKLIKSCVIIEILLSYWPTLIFFIVQKTTLMSFINGLPRKSHWQLEIIKTYILKKIIIRTLAYNKNKMMKSLNVFGFRSNYLNYRGLVLINFLLKTDALYETFEQISEDDQLLQSLSSLCLQYFPHISQNQKYSKKIIKNIKYPRHYQNFIAKEVYKKKYESYSQQILICLKSFCKPSLIFYYFQPKQLRNNLIWLKQNKKIFDNFSEQLKQQIQINLEQVKRECQSQEPQQKGKMEALLANLYKVGIHACEYIPWRAQNLKFARFLSSILQFLVNNKYDVIFTILIRIMKTIFEQPQQNYNCYLICTVLDDIGRYLPTNQECQSAMKNNYKDDNYSFRISKILLNIDYEKFTDQYNKPKLQAEVMSPKKLLQYFCEREASDYVTLQIIQIIKRICYENIQKNQQQSAFLIQLIPNNLIYHKNQEIVSSCIEFFQQININKSGYMQRYIKMIKLDKIRMQFHRKRAAYLFLAYEEGFQTVSDLYPQLFKQQLQNWVNKGSSLLKQYSSFILKQVKKFNNVYTKERQNCAYLFLGFQEQERRYLSNLPWNVVINGECFPALAQYKVLKQKMKLRVRVSKAIQSQTTISVLNIGMNSFGKQQKINSQNSDSNSTVITIRIEQIMKSYERNRNKEIKQQTTRFAVTKQQVTLFFRVDQKQSFILQKLNINIHLEKSIYRPLLYPQNFIYLLTMTKSGMQFLKRQKVFQKIVEKINTSQKSFQTLRQNLLFFACYCSGQRDIRESIQKKQFYDAIMRVFWRVFTETTNYQIKQICHWILNVLIKDQEFQNKIKSQKQKKGKFVQTKYGGTLYYYNYSSVEGISRFTDQYDNYEFIKQQMPEKLMSEPQFKEIYEFLNNQTKQLQMLNLNKLLTLKKNEFSNAKVFQGILKYMSLINYSNQKINIVFEMYKKYLSGSKFEHDFQNGFVLP